jgi:hypothetical protein
MDPGDSFPIINTVLLAVLMIIVLATFGRMSGRNDREK